MKSITIILISRTETEDPSSQLALLTKDEAINTTVLSLSGLDDRYISKMVKNVIGKKVSESVMRDFVAKIQGNPLIAMELSETYKSQSGVKRELLLSSTNVSKTAVVSSMRSVLTAKLDTLPGYQRKVVNYASVIGSYNF